MMIHFLDPNVCSVLGCAMQDDPVEVCRDHRCPHRWTREAREDRARREANDAARRRELAGEPSPSIVADCIGMANPVETCAARRCPFVADRSEANSFCGAQVKRQGANQPPRSRFRKDP